MNVCWKMTILECDKFCMIHDSSPTLDTLLGLVIHNACWDRGSLKIKYKTADELVEYGTIGMATRGYRL